MNKIALIIGREYSTRVRKKSFIIMTILGPVLFAALIIGPAWLTTLEDKDVKEIAVVEADANGQPVPDSLQFFRDIIPNRENIKFTYLGSVRLADILKAFNETQYEGVLYLPQTIISAGSTASVELYYRKPPSIGMEVHISKSLEDFLFKNKLIVKNIPASEIQSLQTKVQLQQVEWKNWPNKQIDTTGAKRGLGYAGGFLIYFFIFLFGAQVMRGVLEEKTSRIVEVIVSSVTPFQLMMGKIIGIGLIGLTQFVAWMMLTYGITMFTAKVFVHDQNTVKTEQSAPANSIMSGNNNGSAQEQVAAPDANDDSASGFLGGALKQLGQVKWVLIIGAFIFYFLGGFLLYGSLFAAVGAASDNETDTQQFMLPITIPLILGLLIMANSFLNPSGKIAVIFSLIPLTSPIVMMARIPFGVPVIQLLSSGAILILTFIGSVWLAAKIYRTGILMYGKKVSYKELWKWIRYKS
jgi:ABC-2 type transport system permease protein